MRDVRELTDEDKVRLGIYHTSDHELARRQLQGTGLCALVRERQDKAIGDAVVGTRVLDIGSGYGTMTLALRRRGFEVMALEPHQETRDLARAWFGIESVPWDVYTAPLSPGAIDTAIFRESVEHLDMELALARLAELAVARVIIFQSNLNWMLKLARLWIRQDEFNPLERPAYEGALRRHGFTICSVTYRDVVAFPLSGGLLFDQRFPRVPRAERAWVALDEALGRSINRIGLGSLLSWRYLIVADLATPAHPQ
jgi:SAM-dependent methyltransferase